MTQKRIYPDWKETVVYSAEGPEPQMLLESGEARAMIAGLEAGQKVPPHKEGPAVYHFLEGTGHMIVDGERLAVQSGATVVVPEGIPRGIEAETQLAFLGARLASLDIRGARVKPKRGALMTVGLVAMFGLMMAGMVLSALTLSSDGGMGLGMLRLMTSSGSGLGLRMWGLMLIPFVGMVMMLAMMFVFFRRMAGGGPMPGMMSHSGPMSVMMRHGHAPQSHSAESTTTTLTYDIPAVHCPHCKITIEREVSELVGVSSVSVDVDARQAVIRFESPTTEAEIEARLAEIGYPPQSP